MNGKVKLISRFGLQGSLKITGQIFGTEKFSYESWFAISEARDAGYLDSILGISCNAYV